MWMELLGAGMGAWGALGERDNALKEIQQHNKNIENTIAKLESHAARTRGTMESQTTDILNRYALSKDPGQSSAMAGMYGQAIGSGRQSLDKISSAQAELELKKLDPDSIGSALEYGIGGALGGFGMGAELDQMMNTNDFIKKKTETEFPDLKTPGAMEKGGVLRELLDPREWDWLDWFNNDDFKLAKEDTREMFA